MEEQQQQQAKRRRRPSVRLGEIGIGGPYDASAMWIEAPRQRRKSAPADVLSTGKPRSRSPGAKAPRIRPLEQLGRAEEAAVVEEEWAVIEPTEGSPPKGKGSGARRAFNRKANTNLRGKGRLGWTSGRKDEAAEQEDDSDEKENVPVQADDEEAPIPSSSESEELLGSDLKGEGEEETLPADDSGNAGSDGSDEAEPEAKPNSRGDEMQGAIEDGPGRVNGKVFSRAKQRPGERRSGRQAAIRAIRDIAIRDVASRDILSRDTASRDIASRDTASRDTASRDIASRDTASRDTASRDIASRDTASRDTAGEPSGRFQSPAAVGNGTTATIVTPNSSERGALSAGVSGWLQELGLGKYLELFERNEVDTEVLPHLTLEDLREMGVDAVGARRKMFNGIQELGRIRGM